MAPRTFWKGYLKLSLVTCPVTMMPATTQAEKVRFRTINRKTGNPVESRYVDAATGKPLGDDDQIKGYETGEDEYVLLEEDEIDAVALESTRTIDIETFVPADSIGWIWLDRPHYLLPDDAVGEEAFCVIRDAMAESDKVGISRLVMYRREHAVMLEPRDKGIIVWTLRSGEEVRGSEPYFEGIEGSKPDAKHLRLVKTLIDERTTAWDPSMVDDPVQERLKSIIAAKKKGRKKPARKKAETQEPKADNVVSIMDALRKSLDAEKGVKGKSR